MHLNLLYWIRNVEYFANNVFVKAVTNFMRHPLKIFETLDELFLKGLHPVPLFEEILCPRIHFQKDSFCLLQNKTNWGRIRVPSFLNEMNKIMCIIFIRLYFLFSLVARIGFLLIK